MRSLTLCAMLMLAPVVWTRDGCDAKENKQATCFNICRERLPGKTIYRAERVGRMDDGGEPNVGAARLCVCYTARVIVADADEQPRTAVPEKVVRVPVLTPVPMPPTPAQAPPSQPSRPLQPEAEP